MKTIVFTNKPALCSYKSHIMTSLTTIIINSSLLNNHQNKKKFRVTTLCHLADRNTPLKCSRCLRRNFRPGRTTI